MATPVVNPPVPYNGGIPGGLQPGKMCRIQGSTQDKAERFEINLQTGPCSMPGTNTGLQLSFRFHQGYVARNSYINGAWGSEEAAGSLLLSPGQQFEVLILVQQNFYKVALKGNHFCEFQHRIPIRDLTHLFIEGNVNISIISWEGFPEQVTQTQLQGVPLQVYNLPQQCYGVPMGYGPIQSTVGQPRLYGTWGRRFGYGLPADRRLFFIVFVVLATFFFTLFSVIRLFVV